ncbi:hypothetical protein BLOT_011184, partial [Blomia tropicalis]
TKIFYVCRHDRKCSARACLFVPKNKLKIILQYSKKGHDHVERYKQTLQTNVTSKRYKHTLQTHVTNPRYKQTLQTNVTNKRYKPTLQANVTNKRYKQTLQTHVTNKRYKQTLQTNVTSKRYKHTLQTNVTSKRYKQTLQTNVTNPRYKQTLQTHVTNKRYKQTLQANVTHTNCLDIESPLIIDCQSGLSTPKSIGSIKHYQNGTTVPNELRYNQFNHWPKKFGIKENTKIQIRNRCKFPHCDKLSPYNITDKHYLLIPYFIS